MPIDDIERQTDDPCYGFLTNIDKNDPKFKEKEVTRIHQGLGHPSRAVMDQMFKDVIWEEQYFQEIIEVGLDNFEF